MSQQFKKSEVSVQEKLTKRILQNITLDMKYKINNSQRLGNPAASTNMVIISTKFGRPKYPKVTWLSPGQETWAQIDYIFITRKKQPSIRHI